MSETKRRVMEKTKEARNQIKHHPLDPKMAMELLKNTGIGVFRFSSTVVQLSWQKLEELKKMWIQAYKYAWHLPLSTAPEKFIFKESHASCLGYPVLITIMTQEPWVLT